MRVRVVRGENDEFRIRHEVPDSVPALTCASVNISDNAVMSLPSRGISKLEVVLGHRRGRMGVGGWKASLRRVCMCWRSVWRADGLWYVLFWDG